MVLNTKSGLSFTRIFRWIFRILLRIALIFIHQFLTQILIKAMVSAVSVTLRKGVRRGYAAFRGMIHGIFVLANFRKRKIVSATTDPILFKSATVLAAEIREGKIHSEDVVRSYINRIKEVEPLLNAVVDNCFEQALDEAIAVDALIASQTMTKNQLEKSLPLLGVPFTVKVLLSVKGMRCTAGSTFFQEQKAEVDSECVAFMKSSGAICVCTTNSPEFGLYFETFNKVHGRTSNPYDTTRTSGGSSGGEGALIGAAASVIGLGNDLGGSVRFPAFNNCIFAHKPTVGVISNKGTFPVPFGRINSFLSVGPMCRYADDLITSMKVLAADKAEQLGIGRKVNFSELTICYMMKSDHVLAPSVDKEIRKCIKEVVQHFESSYQIKSKIIEIEEMRRVFDIWTHLCRGEAGEDIAARMVGPDVVVKPSSELIKFAFGRSDFSFNGVLALNLDKLPILYKAANVSKMEKRLEELEKIFSCLLDDRTVLIMPTFPKPAMYHYEWMWSSPGVGYTALFNMLGYPATQCPLGLNSKGLPIGLQVVGCKDQDNLTLAFALEIEKVFGGWIPPWCSSDNTVSARRSSLNSRH